MIEFSGTFTDTHGISHTDPVFVISRFDTHLTNNTHHAFNRETEAYESNVSESSNTHYSVVYWTNIASYNEGKQPLQFVADSGEQNFFVQQELTLEECETHFQNTYLQS